MSRVSPLKTSEEFWERFPSWSAAEIHHGGDGSATRVANVKLESMMLLCYIKLQRLQTVFTKVKHMMITIF